MPEYDAAAESSKDASSVRSASLPAGYMHAPNLPDMVTRLEVQMEGVYKRQDQATTKSDLNALRSDINAGINALRSDITVLDGKFVNLDKRFDDLKSSLGLNTTILICQFAALIAIIVYLLSK
jgi:hypothetical protein